MTQTNSTSKRKPAYIHGDARSLVPGDEIRLNDDQRPLTVSAIRSRPNLSQGSTSPYTVIEMEGDQTTFHLLTWERASNPPLLYDQRELEKKTGSTLVEWEYPEEGEQVEQLTTVDPAS